MSAKDAQFWTTEIIDLLGEWRKTCVQMALPWTDRDAGLFLAAALADRLEQAERDKAAVERVRALCDDYHLISADDVLAALDGTEADR